MGDGRWFRKTLTGRLKDVLAERDDLLSDIRHGRPPGGKQVVRETVGQLVRVWLKDKAGESRTRTLQRYESAFRMHIEPALGRRRLDSLKAVDYRQFFAGLPVERGGAKIVKTVLYQAYEQGIGDEIIPQPNPIARVKVKGGKPTERQMPTPQQVADVLEVAGETYPPDVYAGLFVAARTGLRRGELAGLRWENVDLLRGILRVRISIQPVKGQLLHEPPKTKKGNREIAVDAETVAVLLAHRERQDEDKATAGSAYADDGWVWANPRGKLYTPGRLTDIVAKVSRQVEGGGFRLHDMRHYFASIMLRHSPDWPAISAHLGHSSLSITLNVYGHSLPDSSRTLADAFAGAEAAARATARVGGRDVVQV